MTDCQCLYWVLQVSPSFFYNPNIVVSIDIRYQAYLLSATYGRQYPILITSYWMAVSAVSLFLYYILDGSIGSIPVSLLYIGWQYRQYHIQLLYIYISFSLNSLLLYLEKTPLFLWEKKTIFYFNFSIFLVLRYICFHLLLGKNQKLLFFRRKLKPIILHS